MPPRGRGAQSDEVKKQNFDNWQASEENSLCLKIFAVRKNESHELGKIQDGTDDIIDDWQPVLNNIFKLVETLKVPGRKAKRKLHIWLNLMFNLVDLIGQSMSNLCSELWCSNVCKKTLSKLMESSTRSPTQLTRIISTAKKSSWTALGTWSRVTTMTSWLQTLYLVGRKRW